MAPPQSPDDEGIACAEEGSNCDRWATVDFGHGPVEVRCTVNHEAHPDFEEHQCFVVFLDDEEPQIDPSMN